uniref:Uncharacterized protein n=1 Tax=Avena sativa TaxID=4498 RepID=A0ACD5VBV7_AVESA
MPGDRYKAMKGSNHKPFTLHHCWKLLEHITKWTLRDQEVAPDKDKMKEMDNGSDEEDGGRNKHKPEVNKKAKERIKHEVESSSLRDKIDDMVEVLITKTLEMKMMMNEMKMMMKQSRWEAIQSDAKYKNELEERRLKIKKAKAMKELIAEEKETMMMDTSKMTPVQMEVQKST